MWPNDLTTPTCVPWGYKTMSSYIWGVNNDSGSLLTLTAGADTAWACDCRHDHDSTSINSWLDSTDQTKTACTSDNRFLWGNWEFRANPNVPYDQFWITSGHPSIAVDPKELKRMAFDRRRQALIPPMKATRFGLPKADDLAELKARQLLKSFIGGERFRRYLKDGFISVTSPVTSLVYQIFPGYRSVVVRDKGKRTASCCIVFKHEKLPPTDWVIMRMALIIADETTFYEKANVSGQIPERLRKVA